MVLGLLADVFVFRAVRCGVDQDYAVGLAAGRGGRGGGGSLVCNMYVPGV